MLEQVLKEEEDLNMDMVWAVVDWYKQAALLTRENDVELEAIALSRLGKVYDSVLKMKAKAQENLKRSIQLAMSLHPRTFNSEGKLCILCLLGFIVWIYCYPQAIGGFMLPINISINYRLLHTKQG